MLPAKQSKVFHTKEGTPYLKEPGVVMISRPDVNMVGIDGFLWGFDEELGFHEYILDGYKSEDSLDNGTQLCKIAGQLCYMSFGPNRTKNKDAERYFKNIIRSGHGSVLEHANFSFLIYGVSRSLTHELVRHRAGMAYSQVSQRYVDGSKLRFVERPEFQGSDFLHQDFENRIDYAKSEYSKMAFNLVQEQLGSGLEGTDKKKAINQVARAILPNETEAPIVATGNVRAWRHILEMRGSVHAESEIRNMAVKLYECINEIEPILFQDFFTHKVKDVGTCIDRRPL